MQLTDVMSADVLTTTSDTMVAQASRLMVERGVGSACVVDEDGRLIGILTERDVLRAAASGLTLTGEKVGEWMTSDPLTVDHDEILSRVAKLMADRNFRHVPIVHDGALEGIVSLRDVWRFAFLPDEPDDLTLR